MPRASKAVDAAKKLGRKVAAAGGDRKSGTKSTEEPAAKPTKAPARTSRTAKPAKAPQPAKAQQAKAAKKADAGGSSSSSKAATPAKKAEKRAEAPAKAAKHAKPAEGGGSDRFFEEQRALLEQERATYVAQAADLKAEADQLAQEMEPGDIQFDDESGEGGTAAVDRERDLALSAQARIEVDEIDHALAKLAGGSYGACEGCGQPIPRARLRALPHARLCVACKSGGLSRR